MFNFPFKPYVCAQVSIGKSLTATTADELKSLITTAMISCTLHFCSHIIHYLSFCYLNDD